MAPSTPSPALDHIVLLLPHTNLHSLPSWLTDSFTISPGGRHADGVTENKLILFRDGVYLELIAFIPGQDDGRRSHRWGGRREGHIIDWANTLPTEEELDVVRERVKSAGTGIAYATPQPGGRVRPDGVELKWVTCSPEFEGGGASAHEKEKAKRKGFVGGEAPFWCLDRTPRELRVPYQVHEGSVRHPCGALGLHGVKVYVREAELFGMVKATYDALQGEPGKQLDEGGDEGFTWSLSVPDAVATGPRVLSLIRIGESDTGRGDVAVELSLFTSASADGRVGGTLGDEKWTVEFALVPDLHT